MDQSKWKPRVIVIGPGGAKGLMILGFLSPIEDYGILQYIDTYCGVSIGAVISLLIIVGYKIREIVAEASKIDFFKDLLNIDINTIINQKGLMSNQPAREKLKNLVLKKLGCIPTLYDLYMKTGKSLITTTLNATDEVTEYMGPFTHPTISCIDAVMYSMNIPFIYYQLLDNRGKTYVDGALANPYPVDYFDNGNIQILGIFLKTSYFCNKGDMSITNYLYKLLESSMNQRRIDIINTSSDCCHHVCLENAQKDIIGITLQIQDKVDMLVSGYNVGKTFIQNLYNNPLNINKKEKYHYPQYYLNQVIDARDKKILNIL